MPALAELQARFRHALLDDGAGLADLVAPDGLDVETRLDIHRTNVFVSLTDALAATFPAVCRLVDARFFAYAAHEFVRAAPPLRPCLADYGEGFGDFLATFPPCRGLAWLADVARLEWAVSRAAQAPDAAAMEPQALAAVAPRDTPRLRLRWHPAAGYLASPWPVDEIWRRNRADAPAASGPGAIDLAAGAVRLEIARRDGALVLQPLAPGTFAFRDALAREAPLAAAAEAALAADPDFDVMAGFADLFRDGLVTGFGLAPRPATSEPATPEEDAS